MSDAKMVELNLVFDVTSVATNMMMKELTKEQKDEYLKTIKEWEALPKDKRPEMPKVEEEFYTAAEMTGRIIMDSIKMVKPSGNIQLLRRTKNLANLFKKAVDEKATSIWVTEDDLRYIKSTFAKADKWNNIDDVASLIIAVMELIEKAIA